MVRKEACWTISNITAGTSDQIRQVYDSGLFTACCQMLCNDDIEVKKEAVWAISNTTTSADMPLLIKLIEAGMINSLCVSLRLKSVKMVAVALEGISTLLEIGAKNFMKDNENLFALEVERVGGLEALEELQHH